MQGRKHFPSLSSIDLVILIAAAVKFALHMYIAPGYGLFADEFYTIALSKLMRYCGRDASYSRSVPYLIQYSRVGQSFATCQSR